VPVDQVSYLVPAVGWVVQGPEYPGRVLADLAVMIADGGDALTHLAVLRDQGKLFGPVASEPTAWRAVERVDEGHLGPAAGGAGGGAGAGVGGRSLTAR
jgi:hypothetical protein